MSHAIERARERYGLELSGADLSTISQRCLRQKVGIFQGQNGETAIYLICYHDQILKPVIDKRSGTVVTFLPLAQACEKLASP